MSTGMLVAITLNVVIALFNLAVFALNGWVMNFVFAVVNAMVVFYLFYVNSRLNNY